MTQPLWPFPPGSVVPGRSKRGKQQFIPTDMRSMHVQLIGATGTGKSKAIELMVRQDILAFCGVKRGLFVLDPHGTMLASLLSWYVSHGLHRYRPIRILDPANSETTFAFNPLRPRNGVDPAVIASAFANAVAKVSGGLEASAMPQYRETLKAVACAAVELELSLLDCIELLAINDNSGLRAHAIERLTNPVVRQFFVDLEALPPRSRDEKVGSAKRRLNEFVLPAAVRRIFGQREHGVDLRQLMDDGELVFVNLAHGDGKLSEDEGTLLGTLLINDLFLSCLGRPEGATSCYLYLDECHRFLTTDVANILDQSRKFGLHAVLGHQHLGQLREAGEYVYRSVMTNTRTKLVFGGLDADDAEEMARNIFRGQFDLQRPKERYIRPMVVGQQLEWLLSESAGFGTTQTVGRSSARGGGTAHAESTTESESETDSESVTVGEAHTTSESMTVSTGRSRAQTHGTSSNEGGSRGRSDAESWSSGVSSSQGSSASENAGRGWRVRVRERMLSEPEDEELGDFESRTSGTSNGTTRSASTNSSHGRSAGTSSGESWSKGTSASLQETVSDGRAHTVGSSHTTSTAHTSGHARTTGTAHTRGVTESATWQRGESTASSVSAQFTRGRNQGYRSIFKELPTTSYSLEELVHLAAVQIANLPRGQAILKIGQRPAVPITVLRVAPGWARAEHIESVRRMLADSAPFVASIAEAEERYLRWRAELQQRIRPPTEETPDEDTWG